MKRLLCLHVYGISLYINCVLFESGKNSGYYGNLYFSYTCNGKCGNLHCFSVSMGIFENYFCKMFIKQSSVFRMNFIGFQGDALTA